jgi:hypothetical protein
MPPFMFSKHNRKILIFTLVFCGVLSIALTLLCIRYGDLRYGIAGEQDKEPTAKTFITLLVFFIGVIVLPFIGAPTGLWLGQKMFGPIRKAQSEDSCNGSPSK